MLVRNEKALFPSRAPRNRSTYLADIMRAPQLNMNSTHLQRVWLLPRVDANACKIERTVVDTSEPTAVLEQRRIISLARAANHTNLRFPVFSYLPMATGGPNHGVHTALIGPIETTNL